ncbi:MAG TPA: AIM24 family protein [Ktedonobacteraceae bacterium]|nr:AIM24 family protein [Ktedonobacteraceae bacterium]
MICPHCQSQVADGIKFCGVCGKPLTTGAPPAQPAGYPQQNPYGAPPAGQYGGPPSGQYGSNPNIYIPPNQYEEYRNNEAFGAAVPRAELHNPKGPLRVADMTITIDGELVPVVDVMLGNQLSIYFEHHILLWKHPGVQIGFKSLKGAAKRLFAGLQIFINEAQGPGNISFSRDSVGQIVALRLQPGQMVEVREHQFLFATSNVDYNFTFVQGAANILFSRTGLFIDQFTCTGGEGMLFLHGYGNVFEKMLAPGETLDVEPGAWLWKDPSVQMTVTTVAGSQRGGGILGAIAGFAAGASITLNRFTGPGRLGIQSMTYHPPQTEGASQAGGQSNINLGQFFS